MNHQEALEGLKRMGLTMPTEAQWEYVARAGTKTIYWTGDKVETLQWAANIADSHIYDKRGPGHFPTQMELFDGYFHHAPVGTFTANQFGVHDILGNVWEWCLDAYGSYKTSVEPKTGKRLVSEGSSFVFRGGGYKSSAKQARSATRAHAISLSHHSADLGLRACRPVVR
jgi:formylglycine-generating enzyme required for sulfatase activity